MEFWSLFMVASMPVLQVLIICLLGSFLASSRINVLTTEALTNMNKIVFAVFAPALGFAAIVKSVTFKDLISWWFMTVNLGIIVFVGAFLGWIAVKILKPRSHIRGLIVATCATGNFGYLPLMVVPALCNEKGNPFGDSSTCCTNGLAYVSFSTAIGGIFIWTFSYHLMRKSSMSFETTRLDGSLSDKIDEKLDKNEDGSCIEESLLLPSSSFKNDMGTAETSELYRRFQGIVKETIDPLKEVLLTPPMLSLMLGLVIGTIPWLKVLLVGDTAILRPIQDSIVLLGNAAIPSVTLILGANLTQGLRKIEVKLSTILAIVLIRYLLLPIIGIGTVLAAAKLGLVLQSPLFQYVMLILFAVPPGLSLGTMAQLFGVGQEECSVILLWSYVVAAFAFTVWSTVFMWILT
ncbi:Auxin Efflux Carrier family protein [Rhynchospora pubera]|uniref:Auxin Efflux Carrier family protein n=1 Tax=Rhynchospora pubera TaxID=906938 RepID=A0AAV8BU05_9POAL|nr:Auxin Efflux Carrier family protein [Rhynchospora pubera]